MTESSAFPAGISTDAIRVQLLKVDRERKLLICMTMENPGTALIARYGISPENSVFDSSVDRFQEGANLNLIDCIIDGDGFLIPNYIILEPDYLIDASAIAECFQDYLISPLHYFRNKFEEKENRSYLLLGNLANFFLDELVFAENPEEVSFRDVFLRSFKQSPFEYTSCEDIRSDSDFRAFMEKAQSQFENIKRVIREDFPGRGINLHYCTLEPSFFSERFGFQGRLDLLQPQSEETDARIVELKSGRLPFPSSDSNKITLNHEVQTAVYRLMIETVFGKKVQGIDASILYSTGSRPGENLRTATVNGELEKSILNIRNLIVANEQILIRGENRDTEALFKSLINLLQTEKKLPEFFTGKIERIRTLLSGCSETELTFFYRYIRFISRELYHHKIGDIAYETPTGTASLWNSAFSERAEALDVLFNLTILTIDDSGHDMTILFTRNHTENDIVNFREGEICIVYPRQDDNDTVLNRQILKGAIARITVETVEVRFRYKQKNRRFFEENRLWAIEHDSLDSSYNSMYKSLFSFLGASPKKKKILMGLALPGTSNDASEESKACREENHPIETSQEAGYPENIIRKAMSAQDYFLIVGPPGTGKTSIFARRLIEEYHTQPGKNIMVLAYTNRAVDELCEAINAAFGCKKGECDAYIRVGTELSCTETYRHRLLQRISEKAKDRESLRHEIERTRIYISTLASINGRMELFNLKHFHVAIIDEASQILEPQIIGLLPRFDRFIMIGDHHQLSTIVLQDRQFSGIDEPVLCEAGFIDCRDSLFERLLRLCKAKGWHHAYAQLTHQGRMHNDIAAFPATSFYSGNLFPALDWQLEEWKLHSPSDNLFDRWIAAKRTAFFSTEKINRASPSDKINETEADLIITLLTSIRNVYEANGNVFDTQAMGIIAPYRNQIALIKHKLSLAGIPHWEKIMIDTVERYQGSQRDVILISFCANKPYQMDFLCNPNHDGTVDRKLNVAITRARRQLFLVGNATVLRESPVYTALLDFYKEKDSYLVVVR
ncbi:AAA domain-containing protein [Proteiniphilum acetatigenes]|uniref:AAA domain-containing protein n=1 Tax=Proteiniphilum acetatigenes TaxID=294710 RepID=UPI0003661E0C|nr:AAA domain-containing protein [Proteiniphilum acetatigenes]SFK65611.1 DNA replication ATP-dependent helicase Dna2 [Porphyromonadaceae bacterium KH3CP3RA]